MDFIQVVSFVADAIIIGSMFGIIASITDDKGGKKNVKE